MGRDVPQTGHRQGLIIFPHDSESTEHGCAADGVVSREEWETAFGKGSFDSWDIDGATVPLMALLIYWSPCADDGTVNYKEWCKIYLSKHGRNGETRFYDNLPSQKQRRATEDAERRRLEQERIDSGGINEGRQRF